MFNTDKLCMGCMKRTKNEKVCPFCGFDESAPVPQQFLAPRTNLLDRYLVGRVLSSNGEGTSYLGWDYILECPIVIREFYPETLAVREANSPEISVISGCEQTFNEYKISFLEYWRAIARMRDLSAIVPVYDIFEENNTAYTISEYYEGVRLSRYLQQKGGALSWEAARVLFMPVLSGLSSLHSAGIMHYGICPDNLVVGKDGKMKLVGFSIAAARTAMTDLTPQLYPGYSAIEQYGYEASLGSATDIYGFAATLFRTLTGIALPVATARETRDIITIPERFSHTIPVYVINALANALMVNPDERTRSFERLRAELSDAPTVAPSLSATVEIEKVAEEEKEKKKGGKVRYGLLALLVSILMLFAFGAVFILTFYWDRFFSGSTSGESSSSAAPSEVSEPSSEVSEPASQEPTYATPDLVGKNFEIVRHSPAYSFFVIEKAEEVFSDTVPEGYIIEQVVAPETPLPQGATIKVKVSKGPQMRTVPDVVGMTYDEALNNLHDAGLKIRFEAYENVSALPDNTITRTEPAAGTQVEYGTEIRVFVNKKQ